ncbi:hypothetical protein W97_08702 [Coniosporium apollinis CBS 100218]|uniref:DNA-directed RNA polymerase subunit n=1 Tax=Coniosporium apollinis (strain CBS 100218) TaxID=1168221 RepID=R7Z5J8_CONA1|nr:uncharacterized protein W97_08702 [Coniosporium apollinis CBS 100218]EON69442.1 hypothetical protein W97_08702 [Coniosporium apollinis CBS 100218]
MSAAPETPKKLRDKSQRKPKDPSTKALKNSSKKRPRDDAESSSQLLRTEASPSKRQRTAPPTGEPSTQHQPNASATAQPLQSPRPEDSPFVHQTISLYLPLSPITYASPIPGLCAEHLSPLLLTYYPPLHGVVLSYANVRLSAERPSISRTPDPADIEEPVLALSIDEYAASFVWATADFVVLRPRRGVWLEGYVNLLNESYLGLVVYNLFSASVHRNRLPRDWRWVEETSAGDRQALAGAEEGHVQGEEEVGRDTDGDVRMRKWQGRGRQAEGYYVDGEGEKVDGLIRFRIKDFESGAGEGEKGFLSIEGTMLSEDEEEEADEQERAQGGGAQRGARGRSRPQTSSTRGRGGVNGVNWGDRRNGAERSRGARS